MMNLLRQLSLININDVPPILIVGAGGIGSNLAIHLAKMGITNISVCDFDEVSDHNFPNQFFKLADLGRKKVDALYDIVKEFTGTEIITFDSKFLSFMQQPIIILSVDSILVRKRILRDLLRSKSRSLILDCRMGGLSGLVIPCYLSDSKGVKEYEKTFYDDPDNVPCTARAIIYNIAGISFLVGSMIRRYINGKCLTAKYLDADEGFICDIKVEDLI